MARKRYDEATGKWIDIPYGIRQRGGGVIMPDLAPFVSPVDGKVISGRKAMRDHFKQHGVTNTADYTDEWARKKKEREQFYTPGGGYDRERRIEALKYAYDKHSRRR